MATSFVGSNTANFTNPAAFGNGQGSLTILDQGNPAYNAAAPFATPFEYAYYTTNTVGTNTISGLTRGVAGTTAHSFFAGALVAQGLVAEDIVASVPWVFDEQVLGGTAASIRIPASGSIPASYLGINYRHLRIKWFLTAGTNGTTTSLVAQFNGDTATNYSYQLTDKLNTSITGSFSGSQISIRFGIVVGTNSAAGAVSGGVTEIPGAFTAQAHPVISRCWRGDNVGGLGGEDVEGNWFNASVITSILVFPVAGLLSAGTIITTYLEP